MNRRRCMSRQQLQQIGARDGAVEAVSTLAFEQMFAFFVLPRVHKIPTRDPTRQF
jgi:hypothetical protein